MIEIENKILSLLPYRYPFRFVEEIREINQNGVVGTYTLKEDEFFYSGHFPQKKVTPGVIIIEVMAQIGLVCHGIYLKLLNEESLEEVLPAFTSSNVDFMAPVFPEEKLEIRSSKIYYRFNKLKSEITCKSLNTGKIVCKGEFSGMIITKEDD